MRFNRYRYPLKDHLGSYYGYYTIKESVKPMGFKDEKLVETFTVDNVKE